MNVASPTAYAFHYLRVATVKRVTYGFAGAGFMRLEADETERLAGVVGE